MIGLCGAGYVLAKYPDPTDAAIQQQELICDSIEEVGQQSGLEVATNLAANLVAAAQ